MLINIFTESNNFSLGLYEKRSAFPFSIVRMPYLCNDTFSKGFFASLGSELIIIARLNNNNTKFFYNTPSFLVKRMINHEEKITNSKRSFKEVTDHCFMV